jgi:hypothetical protein
MEIYGRVSDGERGDQGEEEGGWGLPRPRPWSSCRGCPRALAVWATAAKHPSRTRRWRGAASRRRRGGGGDEGKGEVAVSSAVRIVEDGLRKASLELRLGGRTESWEVGAWTGHGSAQQQRPSGLANTNERRAGVEEWSLWRRRAALHTLA